MATTLSHKVSKRTSLPLTQKDLEDLAAISTAPGASAALDVDEAMSEAAILHRLFQLGVAHAYQVLDELGYAELAQDEERAQYQHLAKSRRHGR